MNWFISFLLSLCVVLINPVFVTSDILKDSYVAVFVSQEFASDWFPSLQRKEINLLFTPKSWKDLSLFVKDIKERSGNSPIVIELDCHGGDTGLSITNRYLPLSHEQIMDSDTFGHVLDVIYQELGNRQVTILCEACFSGNAYANTAHRGQTGWYIIPYPVYGVGSGFSNYGSTVYLQTKNNVKLYYEDLRTYEYKKPAPHEPEDEKGHSKTLLKLRDLYNFFHKA